MDWLTQLLQSQGAGGGVLPGPTGGEAAPMGVPDQPYSTPGSLGEALQPAPGGGSTTNALLAGLKGVQAMPKPDVVKPSTPAAPQRTQIQAGDLMQLLQAISHPGGQLQPMRQQTLGQAVGTGRY